MNPVEEILLGQKDGSKREKGANGVNSTPEQDMIVEEEGEGEEEGGNEGADADADEGEEEWGDSNRRKQVEEPVKITRWKRISIQEENEFAALPTHVDYDGVIYLHNINKGSFFSPSTMFQHYFITVSCMH